MRISDESSIYLDLKKFQKDLQKKASGEGVSVSTMLNQFAIGKSLDSNMKTTFWRRAKESDIAPVNGDWGCCNKSTFYGYCYVLNFKPEKYLVEKSQIFPQLKEEPEVPVNSQMQIINMEECSKKLHEVNKNLLILNNNIEKMISMIVDIGKLNQAQTDNTHNILMNTRQLMANTKEIRDLWSK